MLCYKYAAIQMMKQGKGGRIIGADTLQFHIHSLTNIVSSHDKEHVLSQESKVCFDVATPYLQS